MTYLSLRTNKLASISASGVSRSTKAISNISERLSSGKKINKPSDDIGGLSIALSLNARSRMLAQGIKNVNDGISALSMASSAISALSDITIKRQELAEQSANGVLSDKQRESLDKEFRALGDEYKRIFESTNFNEIGLLSGGLDKLSLQADSDSINVILKNAFEGLLQNGGENVGFDIDNTSSSIVAQDDGYPMEVVLGDLNGDGFLDMVTTDYGTASQCGTDEGYSNTVSVSLGKGDGTFGEATFYELGTGSRANSVSIADIDSDDVLDLVVQTAYDSNIYKLTGKGDGTFNTATKFDPNLSVLTAIGTGDINGDGKEDIISTGRKVGTSGYRVYVNTGDGTGNFTENLTGVVIGSSSFDLEIADLNNDGKDDVITANRSAKSVSVLMSNGTSTLSTAITYNESDAVYDVTTGDIDGDSILDMVVATGNNLSVYRGAGDGTFTKIGTYEGGNTVTSVALGDVDNDGSLDMVCTAGKDNTISIFSGNGDGSFREKNSYISGKGPMDVAVGDLNNDGMADAVTANSKDSTASAYVAGKTSLTIKTQASAEHALRKLSGVLDKLSTSSGQIGAQESRAEVAVNVMESSRENYLSAKSAIMDVDVAEETANLLKEKILQNSAISIFAQANNQYKKVFELLLSIKEEDSKNYKSKSVKKF